MNHDSIKTTIGAKRLFCFCVSFLLILALAEFLPVSGEEGVYTGVIRLHILANSDSDYDQNVKLLVRDALIEHASDFFDAASENTLEAAEHIKENAYELCEFVDSILTEQGLDYRASLKFGKELYPERRYDGIAYPAGEYISLRIILGEGEGRNWWCVLFPPLCTDMATAKDALDIGTEAKKTFTSSKPKYIIRFKILEFFKKLQQ